MKTLELFQRRALECPAQTAYFEHSVIAREAKQSGHWSAVTWRQHWERVTECKQRLAQSGVEAGDRVALILPSNARWDTWQFGILSLGAVVVGLEPGSDENVLKELSPRATVRLLGGIEVLEVGTPALKSPEGTACYLFTSGTTGTPKPLTFTVSQLESLCDLLNTSFALPGSMNCTVSWLPLTHLFQRVLNLWAYKYEAALYYLESPQALVQELRRIEPTVLIGVPRLFIKIHQGVQMRLGSFAGWGKLRRRALRRLFGNRLRLLFSGSAPLSAEVIEFFHSAGIPLLEAYGVSENAVPIAMNHPHAFRPGSVGKPFGDNELRISPEGEVLVRGSGLSSIISQRYPERLTKEGFLRTGDIGAFDADGFLFLIGRLGDRFKTTNGKWWDPVPLEQELERLFPVDRVLVLGQGRKAPVAVFSFESLAQMAHLRSILEVTSAPNVMGVLLVPRVFSQERKELTASNKMRRQAIEQAFRSELDQLCSEIDRIGKFAIRIFQEANEQEAA